MGRRRRRRLAGREDVADQPLVGDDRAEVGDDVQEPVGRGLDLVGRLFGRDLDDRLAGGDLASGRAQPVCAEQSAVTSVLIGEALAHGDMGIAYAALAPGAVATAIGLWGDADQQATYLPAVRRRGRPRRGAGDARAAAALRPVRSWRPRRGATARTGSSTAPSRWSPAPGDCELFVVAAEAEGSGPALFVVESGAEGLSVEPEPAMGLRPAATGRLLLEGVELPGRRAARRGRARAPTPSASTARGSPGARSRSAPRRRCSTT